MKLTILLILFGSLHADDFYYANKQKVYIHENITQTRTLQNSKEFYTNENNSLTLNNTILVEFINTNNLNTYMQKYNLTMQEKLTKNIYLFTIDSYLNTLAVSNILALKNDISNAQPNFNQKRNKR